ncbi:MAG TPA: hypothetical protein VFX86_00590 [Candidatus Saccharimonadales bacterium]|nr:hypothetical protein [Candidatus Saccharimonadales bacterium]
MVKKQKRPVILSMGGVLPRKIQPVSTIDGITQKPQAEKESTKTDNKPESAKKQAPEKVKGPADKRRLSIAGTLGWIRDRILYMVIPVFILGIYLFDLENFPALMSDDGASKTYEHLSDIESADYMPMKLLLIGLAKLHLAGQLEARLLSVAVLLFSLFCFYKLVARWINKRTAVLTLLAYASSTWLLLQARQDGVAVLAAALVPVLLYCGSLVLRTNSLAITVIGAILLAQLLFVPGAVWLFLIAASIGLYYLKEKKSIKNIILPAVLFMSVIVSYMALVINYLSLDSSTQLIKLAGAEVGSLPSLGTMKATLAELPGQLFINGINDYSIWLYKTPIIDFVSAIFLLAGLVYLIRTKSHPVGKKIIFSSIILAILLIAVNGITYISVLLPLIYIIIAVGIAYLIEQWMSIFPNNPLARLLGIAIILLGMFLICSYHTERYFIGWPETEEYQRIFES